jgi:hypothetical protein
MEDVTGKTGKRMEAKSYQGGDRDKEWYEWMVPKMIQEKERERDALLRLDKLSRFRT